MSLNVEAHDLEDPTTLKCPRDGEDMRRFNVGGIKIDRCVVCAGIWVDLGELDDLLSLKGEAKKRLDELDHGAGAPFDDTDRGERRCPRDTALLTPVHDPKQPHIEYDRCTHCGGVFFDSGELADLSRFTLEERLRWLMRGAG
ncbi:MAG: hypothetical protein CMJ31_08745 [Phycisphaerae bacterium]|nr:hypothetical protein [Phycisphaerae bacterium]